MHYFKLVYRLIGLAPGWQYSFTPKVATQELSDGEPGAES